VLLAAAPSWFAENLTLIAVAVLVILTVLVLRVVKETVTRTLLLGLILAMAVFIYVNRDPLQACARDCECEIANQDISVPFCDPNLELSSAVTREQPRA
jgi:hypothetical protein